MTKSKADSARTDAVVSGSQSFSRILRESFWLPENCSVLEYGVPRNDIYFRDDSFRNALKRKLGFIPDDRILLYAPTFRDNGETDCYDLDFERLRRTLFEVSSMEWKVIVRLHPNISRRADLFCYGESIINGSTCPDQQELCMISDCLITDYSSIMGDFLLMKKPVFLYVPDLARYASRNSGRGLRDIYYDLPLPSSHDQNELEQQMKAFDLESYQCNVDSFMQTRYLPFDDGHASERVVDLLTQIMHIHG